MPVLHLVRHGRAQPVAGTPAPAWSLHPEAASGIRALADARVLPTDAVWVSSPEPKAVQTAEVLCPVRFGLDDGLREAIRSSHWFDDTGEFEALVRRSFAYPGRSAHPGWEPLDHTRTRVLGTVRTLLSDGTDRDLVLVGHGTAWTLVVAALTGTQPDLDAWTAMRMPDHCAVCADPRALDTGTGILVSRWGN